jgi:hypothetical protein
MAILRRGTRVRVDSFSSELAFPGRRESRRVSVVKHESMQSELVSI